jgi:transcriptional regulator with XRE-family HTH domain
MGIGSKIKEYRIKSGLTQKDLADQLHITYQAVSRWENDDAEPSFDMLREMCRIFNCSTDDLFEISKPEKEEIEEQPQIIERVIIKEAEQKPVLGVCEKCNKVIHDISDLFRVTDSIRVRSGRSYRLENVQRILCGECNELRIAEEEKIEDQRKRKELDSLRKRRIHSFVWPTILAVMFLIFSIYAFSKGSASSGVWWIVFAILGYTFLATIILNNTFITDMWLEVASWGFVRMPGIIFSLSFDGLAFLIATKILFFLLGILLAFLAAAFATILAMSLSIFVYPFALSRNMKGVYIDD